MYSITWRTAAEDVTAAENAAGGKRKPTMNLREYDISNPYIATLVMSERITPGNSDAEVRHLTLRMPVRHFDYVEGQSIAVLVPGPHEFGNPHHVRLYSIASPRRGEKGKDNEISICVRRCFYVDEISGERYPGRASNYLCDASLGESIEIAGPYGSRFSMPPDDDCNLLMIGAGTGIAPFRAFVKHIYEEHREWKGKVRLFYGARSGMELLYMNDVRKDFSLYYDAKTFRAFEALSPRPHLDAPPAIDDVLSEHSSEVWEMLEDPKTYVYLAGLSEAEKKFERALIPIAGSEEAWTRKRDELTAAGRYSELLYD